MVIAGRTLSVLLLAGGLALPAAAVAQAGPPARVVSINLCTDQLAMLLAAPGQLVSVSFLAQDPQSSAMPEAAMAYAANHAQAEEIYLMNPDLVLAGSFTARATVSMLERLGIRVVEFPPAYSLADVRQGMLDMGGILGREAEAEAMVASWDAGLAAAVAAPADTRPTAATYAANGYMSGAQSLTGEIIEAAGLDHLAAGLGMPYGGFLPLEALVMAEPDLLIMEPRQRATSRAEEVLSHPVLARLGGARVAVQGNDWVCGLPQVLNAIGQLAGARRGLADGGAVQ